VDELWAANQAAGFILAGYETTANALAFTIYCLAHNPDKEARLLAELDGWGPPDRLPSAADMDSFPYAAACFQESLRLFPPAAAAVREAPAGGIQLGGFSVPAGTALQVSIHAMHHNPRYWSHPEAFNPERFMPGTPEAAEVTPGAFMPFGDGARKCIGYRFAMLEGVLTLVALYQQYTFKLLPGQVPLKLKTSLTTGPANGIHVTVHHRRQEGYSAAGAPEE
jgi:thromboxane-A synthase/cytochrome P450 family 3 subfamily A